LATLSSANVAPGPRNTTVAGSGGTPGVRTTATDAASAAVRQFSETLRSPGVAFRSITAGAVASYLSPNARLETFPARSRQLPLNEAVAESGPE